jgi:hypothetical protein
MPSHPRRLLEANPFLFELKERSARKVEMLTKAVEEWRRKDPLG